MEQKVFRCTCFTHQAPAEAGADPKKYLGRRERQGLYMQQQRGCFSAVIFGGF